MAGQVVHLEFVASDADRAQRFWQGLFGWEFSDSGMPDMDYRMTRTGPESGAAIYAGNKSSGHPVMYLGCDDIEASRAKVVELGGSADEKTQVPGHGWFAHCRDSEGTAFSLWQSDTTASVS